MSDIAVPVETSASLWVQFRHLFRWLKFGLFALVGLSLVVLLGETIHLYRMASEVHPGFGIAVVLAIGAGLGLIAVPAYNFLRMPAVVQPPDIPHRHDLRIAHLKAEADYLDRYAANCSNNPELTQRSAEIAAARASLAKLHDRIRQAGSDQVQEMNDLLCEWLDREFCPILVELDKKADRMIYQESLAVGLATAASPNGTLDAFVMLWRSVSLVSRLATLYYGRPGLRGTLSVCRDVSIATAMAGYLQNVTDSLGTILTRTAGGVTGVLAGPAVEGVTNGLVLIRIGYLARERCRSFRKWDMQRRQSAILAALSATQKVAFGLTTEILRHIGTGLTTVVEAARSRMTDAADAVVGGVKGAADQAVKLGQSISNVFRAKTPTGSEM